MIVVPHRLKHRQRGVVATRKIKEGELVWRIDLGHDKLFERAHIEGFTDILLEAAFLMGLFRPAWSRDIWILPAGSGACIRVESKTLKLMANLRFEQNDLVAACDIPANRELVAPSEFDADRAWKNRILKSGGWKRKSDKRAAKPSLKSYLKYVQRTG